MISYKLNQNQTKMLLMSTQFSSVNLKSLLVNKPLMCFVNNLLNPYNFSYKIWGNVTKYCTCRFEFVSAVSSTTSKHCAVHWDRHRAEQ